MTAMQSDGRPRAERLLEPGQRPGERQLERGWQPQRQPGVALARGGYRYHLHCRLEPTAEHAPNFCYL